MTDHQIHFGTKAAAAGGIFTSIVVNLDASDVVRTAILACVGSVVSFTLSLLFRWLAKMITRRARP